MSNPTRAYEPLTSENAALVLIDHQVGLMTGVRDYSIAELKHNVVALAKAAKVLKLPIVVTTTARDSMWDRHFLSWLKLCPGCKSSTVPLSTLSMIRGWRTPSKATGRRKLVFAGLSLEVCAAFLSGCAPRWRICPA
jgi:hypothetical protein